MISLQDPSFLVNASYFQHLAELIESSMTLTFTPKEINTCRHGESFPLNLIRKFEGLVFLFSSK